MTWDKGWGNKHSNKTCHDLEPQHKRDTQQRCHWLPRRGNHFLASGLLLALLCPKANAFLYPYDFGSHADQPRGMINNAALLSQCQRDSALTSRYRSSSFQPQGLSKSTDPSEATGGNVLETEGGLCRQLYPWLTLGAYTAISSFNGFQTTRSENNPIVFPLHKTHLPVVSTAFAVKVIEGVTLGFAAQLFETINVATRIDVTDEFRSVIDITLDFTFNWNIGAAVETRWGVFHGGYQPAFESGLLVTADTPINLDQLDTIASFELELLTINSALDYRPPTWQLGWIGNFDSFIDIEAGLLISRWNDFDPEIFIEPNDPLGILQGLIGPDSLKFHTTVDPYFVAQIPISDTLSLQAGYAHFAPPLKRSTERQPAVSGEIHSLKIGYILKTHLRNKPIYLENQLIYGYMPRQNVSGGGQLSGHYLGAMLQVSLPM